MAFKRLILFYILTTCLFYVDSAFAIGGTEIHYSLGEIANNMTFSAGGLARLITSGCYVAGFGFGFGIGSIIKYKGYRDNPSQITLGQPILLAFISLAFVFMPFIFAAAGVSIFGPGAEAGGASGVSGF